MPVRLLCTLLAALHAHSLESHVELLRNGSVHEFYRLKTLNTLEQVITSVIEKKNKPYEQNFDGKAKWSGFVNFHCVQMNRVMIIRFLGDD